jgi:hypothetical protein
MPLEIRELVIKVTIEDASNRIDSNNLEAQLQQLKSAIIKECAEKINKELETSFER